MAINCDCDDTTGYRTLLQLRQALMVRLGHGATVSNPPPGVAAMMDAFLQDAQRLLIQRPGAQSLRAKRWFTWPLTAGERFYDLPDNAEQTDLTVPCTKQLDPLRVTWVGVKRDTTRYPLRNGVPPDVLSSTITGWPTHYHIRQCIELWPAPAATEGTLVIEAAWKATAFTADTDKPSIDDEAVFLLALANAKAHYGKPDAQNIVSQLEVYLQQLVAGSHGTRRYVPDEDAATPVYVEPKPSVPFA